MLNSLFQLFVLLAAGALLLELSRRRALALVGVTTVALAVAAFEVRVSRGSASSLALRALESGVPISFLRINTGLLLLGLGSVIAAALISRVVDRDRSAATAVASLVILVAAIGLIIALVPLGRSIGWLPSLIAAGALLAALASILIVVRVSRLRLLWVWLDSTVLEKQPASLVPVPASTPDIVWLVGFLIAGCTVAFAPTLRSVTLASVVAATVGHILLRRNGAGWRLPLLPVFALCLLPVFHYFAAITGDPNPAISSLVDAPLSTAAQLRIVPWIFLAAWGFSGLWPIQGAVPAYARPLSIVLLVRLAAVPLSEGVVHWSPIFLPVIVLALFHLAATGGNPAVRARRFQGLLVAGGLLGAVAGGRGLEAATVMAVAATIYPFIQPLEVRGPSAFRAGGRLFWVIPLAAIVPLLGAGLAVQVSYTVLAAGATAAGFWSVIGGSRDATLER
jgi:hypothetical protein